MRETEYQSLIIHTGRNYREKENHHHKKKKHHTHVVEDDEPTNKRFIREKDD